MAFCKHFDLDLISALTGQLVEAFKELEEGTLTNEHISTLPTERGVYHLFQKGMLVYVGKTDDLQGRLDDHRKKISGRHNIDLGEMGFKCLTVPRNWNPLAHEEQLIQYYRENKGGCDWNGSSFGAHDPGRERDSTKKSPDGFDRQFPIREDWPCTTIEAGVLNAGRVLAMMKSEVPYLLRYDTENVDYKKVDIQVPKTGMRAVELMTLITKTLPGWQSTLFPSHMILYKESRTYPYGDVIWNEPVKP